MNQQGKPAFGTGSRAVMTTAHLDHIPEHCDDRNLLAMCQGCHLHYDRAHHAETAARVRAEALSAAGQGVLDLGVAAEAGVHEGRDGG